MTKAAVLVDEKADMLVLLIPLKAVAKVIQTEGMC